MNKKTIIIGVALFIVAILLSTGYFFWNQNKVVSPQQITSTQTDSTISILEPTLAPKMNPPSRSPTDQKINISLKNKAVVSVNNFYRDPETQIFSVNQDAIIKDEPQYKILYYTIDHSFFIFLLGGNLSIVRTTAEQELLKKLNTTESQACDLLVSVLVDKDVGVSAPGMDYKLSFCPNGKPLPQ